MNGLSGFVKVGAAGLLVYGAYMGVNAGDVVTTLGQAAQEAQGVVGQVDLEGEYDYGRVAEPDADAEFWSAESGYGEGEPEVFARIGDDPEAPVGAPSAIANAAVDGTETDPCACTDTDGESDEDCDEDSDDEAVDAREEDEVDCDDEAEG